ncbi:DUF4157 domain-containing protein [Dyadobacter sp. LJ53]|uniref:eCIS core domain-containing protein n=1 Tax=Dyadobacter chenwenxiniae TaxID=2906456 RepID=UPI001F47B366|nr:DUF4157 domain-containing protein [Dyadobacter chenwenxiniae]MCF0048670.1 DUF4157 domain-containing protein [Dyadobacter chenwenxiniae]
MKASEISQKSMTVSAVNDPMEHEADAMADRVMRMQEPVVLQRKCAHCEKEEEQAHRKPMSPFIQTQRDEGGFEVPERISSRISTARGGGGSLTGETKSFMENRFGNDFSNVKIHTDATAVQLSRHLNAQAFTVGNDVFFNEGKFSPETDSGKRLLAHELTHTMQQSGNVRRLVNARNVTCHATGLINPNLTGAEAVQAIADADAEAVRVLQNAEDTLQNALNDVVAGNPADPALNLILQEELGLDLDNAGDRRQIRIAISRIARVRTTLESGYLRYMCRGGNNVSLVGCSAASCDADTFAFTCPGNRLVVLCQHFWDSPGERAGTILHEVFHIWFDMDHGNQTKFANATCLEGFVRRVDGQAVGDFSCAAGAH